MQLLSLKDAQNSANDNISLITEKVIKTIKGAEFPCVFAGKTLELEKIYFSFIGFDDNKSVDYKSELLKSMKKISSIEKTQENDLYRVFLIVFNKSNASWQEDDDLMWRLLSFLKNNDEQPWPDHVPTNPDDPAWSFCFNGIEYFVNLNSPAHICRRSRNLCDHFSLVIQRRDLFDGVIKPQSRQAIRNRLQTYDKQPASPYLGSFGDASNFEWKQYHLPDLNEHSLPLSCPLSTKND